MKRISAAFVLTAALSLGVSAYAQTTTAPGTPPAQGFSDVPAGHWAQEAVQRIAEAGLITGFPDGTYRGNENLTRYQAALIIARLLDLIAAGQVNTQPTTGGDATATLDPATVTALQNAVQELAADLAQLGVRVADLEDNAVTRDDLARVEALATEARDLAEAANAAAGTGTTGTVGTTGTAGTEGGVTADDLARVEEIAQEARDLAEAAAAATGQDPTALQDLTDQIEAGSIAADTALAQARELQDRFDELSGRVDDLESQLGEVGATVEGQADSIAALNDLVVLLNQDVLSLQDRVTQLEASVGTLTGAAEEAANTFATQEDLEALREFTTLLRRDQTALTDRVADIESRVTAVEGRTTALEGRVTTLENNAFTVSGSLDLTYYAARTWGGGILTGSDFDIDRLIPGTVFSTGDDPDTGDDNPRNYADFQRRTPEWSVAPTNTVQGNGILLLPATPPATGLVPAPVQRVGRVSASFSITFGLKARNLTGAANTYPATFGLTFSGEPLGGDAGDQLNAGTGGNEANIRITGISTRFTVGNAPLLIQFGRTIKFGFTPYVFDNLDSGRGDGFVADIDASGVIPFSPKLTVVYGSLNTAADATQGIYYTGARGTLSIIPGLVGGVYFGQQGPDIISTGTLTTVYGLDFTGKVFGLLDLSGEYSVSDPGSFGGTGGAVAAYVKAGASFGIFSLNANYRHIDSPFNSNDAVALSKDTGRRPFAPNNEGFGVSASIGPVFNFITVNGSFNSFRELDNTVDSGIMVSGGAAPAALNRTDYSVSATLSVIGFSITPRYASITESIAATPFYSDTTLGVTLAHDGSAATALIRGLNLSASYTSDTYGGTVYSAAFTRTTIAASADYNLTFGTFSIRPGVVFSQTTNSNNTSTRTSTADGDVTPGPGEASSTADDRSRFGYGIQVNTGPFLFGSLGFNVKYSSDATVHTNVEPATFPGGTYTASTQYFSAGISFSQFLFAGSSLSVTYASRVDNNRNAAGDPAALVVTGSADSPLLGGTLTGIYTQFTYAGLAFSYGVFALDPWQDATTEPYWGSAFRITYSLKF